MRNISSAVTSLVNSSDVLTEHQKRHALTVDVDHARFFESAGSRAIYCVGDHGTYLQFLGAHPKQAADLAGYLANAGEDTRCYLITGSGCELIKRDQVALAASHRAYHLVGLNVIDSTGDCIASSIAIRVDRSGATVEFEAGLAFAATPTNLSALRQIALYEAQVFSTGCEVHTLKIGLSNVTIPSTYRGPQKSIVQQSSGVAPQSIA